MLDSLYQAAVLSRWAAWQDFRVRHPRTWSVLYPVYRAYRQTRRLEHRRIQRRFRDYTMLSPESYRDNLALCETV